MTAKIVHFPCHLRGESATAKAYREASTKKSHAERSVGIARARQIDIDSRPQDAWLKQHHLDCAVVETASAALRVLTDPSLGFLNAPAQYSRDHCEGFLSTLIQRLGPAFHEPETPEMLAASKGFELWQERWKVMLAETRIAKADGRTSHRESGKLRMKHAPALLRTLVELLKPCISISKRNSTGGTVEIEQMLGQLGS